MTVNYLVTLGGQINNVLPVSSSADFVTLKLENTSSSTNVRTNIWEKLDRAGLTPTPVAVDFYHIAVAAYTADQRTARSIHSSDGWGRDIALYLPVTHINKWEQSKPKFEDLLAFLTGDKWSLNFREIEFSRPARREQLFMKAKPLLAQNVSLFSGGMDSFIGAVDLLEKGTTPYLISHYGGGTGKRFNKVQKQISDELQKEFGNESFYNLRFNVEPSGKLTGEKETSSRGRSILFFGLAVLVASAFPGDVKLTVPENGFISLNVPLTYSRLGSHTTRTTHPHTLFTLGEILKAIGLPIELENPYKFSTKGEMLENCTRPQFLKGMLKQTVSCAHPTSKRFEGGKGMGFKHCGYCVPCIVRRAALQQFNSDLIEEYSYDIFSRQPSTEAEKTHLFAFLMALQRNATEPVLPQLLASGPIVTEPENYQEYVSVYKRGMREVSQLLERAGL